MTLENGQTDIMKPAPVGTNVINCNRKPMLNDSIYASCFQQTNKWHLLNVQVD